VAFRILLRCTVFDGKLAKTGTDRDHTYVYVPDHGALATLQSSFVAAGLSIWRPSTSIARRTIASSMPNPLLRSGARVKDPKGRADWNSRMRMLVPYISILILGPFRPQPIRMRPPVPFLS
jgi:hypothetical protein